MSKKAERKERRQARRAKLQTIITDVQQLPDVSGDAGVKEVEANFKKYWPTIKSVLEWGEEAKFTGKKADQAINAIVELGDQAADSPDDAVAKSKFVAAANRYWHPIKIALNAVMILWANDKEDAAIEKIMAIGDILTGQDPD